MATVLAELFQIHCSSYIAGESKELVSAAAISLPVQGALLHYNSNTIVPPPITNSYTLCLSLCIFWRSPGS